MKARPNHREYLKVLTRMTAEARLQKAFELSSFSRELFLHGLRRRFPEMSDAQVGDLARQRLQKCHSRIS
jgi:hypothetical protein